MRNAIITAVLVAGASLAQAQSEAALKQYFEGKQVTLKLDMPATNDGVDIYAERGQRLDYTAYGNRLKRNGTALREGESARITKLRVKDKLIEFQLNGGGYGTLGDDDSTSISVPSASKSKREKRLEDDIKRERDPKKKREMQDDLSDLRSEREREDRRNEAIAAAASEEKRQAVMQARLQGGSRFNLRWERAVPATSLTPEAVMKELDEWLEFPQSAKTAEVTPASSGTPHLRKGLSETDVRTMLGDPSLTTEKEEGALKVVTHVFRQGSDRIETDFVEGVLIRFRVQ